MSDAGETNQQTQQVLNADAQAPAEGAGQADRKRRAAAAADEASTDDGGNRKRRPEGEAAVSAASAPGPMVPYMSSAATYGAAASVKPAVLKLLVNNNDAGHIIGKRGATVNELQVTTGCEIKLSQHQMVFPGTQSRVILLRGTLTQVAAAVASALTLSSEATTQAGQSEATATTILIPLQFAGSLIGHKGENIEKLQAASNTRVQLAGKDTIVQGANERQVTITGSLDNRLHVITMILHQMQTAEGDAGVYQNQSTQYTNSAPHAGGASYGGGMPRYDSGGGGGGGGATVLEISVPDSYVGGVVGRSGATITNIQNTTGARVQLSQKGVYVPGTDRRVITITGQQAQCDAAQAMITALVDEQTARDGGGFRGAAQYAAPAASYPAAATAAYAPQAAAYGGGDARYYAGAGAAAQPAYGAYDAAATYGAPAQAGYTAAAAGGYGQHQQGYGQQQAGYGQQQQPHQPQPGSYQQQSWGR